MMYAIAQQEYKPVKAIKIQPADNATYANYVQSGHLNTLMPFMPLLHETNKVESIGKGQSKPTQRPVRGHGLVPGD